MTEPQTPPYWLPKDHGKWCRAKHIADSDIVNRTCHSEAFAVPLSYTTGVVTEDRVHEIEGFLIGLCQEWREVEPHIDFGSIQGSLGCNEITLQEAERIAFILMKLVDIARDGGHTVHVAADLEEIGTRGHRHGHHPDYHGASS